MEANMILIMVDECGDEVEVARYVAPDFGDDTDAFDIWKDRKIERAEDEYPEAQGFYWEDRRDWGLKAARMMCGLNWDFVDEFLYGAP